MPNRGLIIAIENYPNMGGGADASLPGTRAAAVAFYRWLVEVKGVDPAHVAWASDAPFPATPGVVPPGRQSGAAFNDIRAAIAHLIVTGAGQTDALFVHVGGHGLRYSDVAGRQVFDLIAAADYQPGIMAGGSCIKLQEMEGEFRRSMGPGDHFYFVDACRTLVSANDVSPAALGLSSAPSVQANPTVYTLFSAREGAAVPAAGGFGTHLIDGLVGRGRAKVWDGPRMCVLFESVFNYVTRRLTVPGAGGPPQAIDRRIDGSRRGEILTIDPPPTFECTLQVVNADAADRFTLTIKDERGNVLDTQTFAGGGHRFTRIPDEYRLTITHPTADVCPRPIDRTSADLYDHCTLAFEKVQPSGLESVTLSPPLPPETIVELAGPAGTELVLSDAASSLQIFSPGRMSERVRPGIYIAECRDAHYKTTIRRERLVVEAGETVRRDLRLGAPHPTKDAIRQVVPHGPAGIEFSETLGPLPDDDLATWVSIIGAAQLVADPTTFSKLAAFRLQRFDEYRPGESAVFVLAGLGTERISVGLTPVAAVADGQPAIRPPEIRRIAEPVPEVPGLFQWARKTEPGGHVVWAFPERQASLAIATHCLKNRATLVVITDGADGALSIRQFILPIHSLLDSLDPVVRERLHPNPLAGVRFIARAQRDFERYRRVASDDPGADRQTWDSLLYAKWLDPIGAMIAAYELLRQGRALEIDVVLQNLREFFPRLPDTEAIARLAGRKHLVPATPPLLLDGAMAFDAESRRRFLPLPEGRLDASGPWTQWRGADVPPRP